MMETAKALGLGLAGLALGSTVFLVSGKEALAEASGPDAWRVVDVAPGDTLNARMGPGTDYDVIGEFAHDARGLQQVTCVPLVPPGLFFEMSEAERAALPPRWCLMENEDYSTRGWVAQRYLAEDSAVIDEEAADQAPDPTQEAERLVQRLYRDHLESLSGNMTSPLAPSRADQFFTAPLADRIANEGLQADPLFDAQDSDITDLSIALDEDRPMFRGLITVNADFRNFGEQRRAVVRLRYEDGAPRVIRIEHEKWAFE
ncbi:hypothetical protein [Fodinicurvata fenggangensis]|uniref:hypothetical protein n=1 Tax=Fodinicurvata fenggangensis TaxID=1121830 RepID=UPI00047DFA6E|nr:hypothetical protein [Fodinicurvata fenggangensis]